MQKNMCLFTKNPDFSGFFSKPIAIVSNVWYNVKCYTVHIVFYAKKDGICRSKTETARISPCAPHIVGKRIKNFGDTHSMGNANLRF